MFWVAVIILLASGVTLMKTSKTCGPFWWIYLRVCSGRESLVVMLVLMLVIAVLVVFVIQFQQIQHLLHSGLQSSTQVLAAVGFPKWRHVDESRATLPQVQRGVVGVVTQIPSSILRYRKSDPEVRVIDPFADCFHVQDWLYAVGAVLHATLGSWAEVAVIQAFVTLVVATLLQGDCGS